ncbi:hypothetical protein OG976_17750 [Mycobacterium sp. NBC_00419]|uniref:hypothetical protein n=1 Tax=Mycobacterium sp. NBC_00419 TaxID=2975989 RepID=UPI002E216399
MASSFGFGRAPQRNPLKGKVLFHDTFDDGFNGWRDHFNGGRPCPPISLTSYPVISGSHALMIGCSAAPADGYAAGWASGTNAAAFKNLSRYYDDGLVTFSCYLTHGCEGSPEALSSYWLMIDTQLWDSSDRAFFKLMVDRDPKGDRTLSIANNSEDRVQVRKGSDLFAGDNENKFNFDWLSLTVDLGANGGLGGYHSCQVNKQTFDLTRLSAGNAKTKPQTGDTEVSFAGGLNFGVLAIPGPPGSGEAFVVIDEAIATVDEKA